MEGDFNPSLVESFDIWLGIGKGRRFRASLPEAFRKTLKQSMNQAADVYRERRASKTRQTLMRNLNSAGFLAISQSALPDRTDSIGLIGEILAEHFSRARKFEILWSKWKIGGTSKSPGIDLVARNLRNSEFRLIIIESKHIHNEAKGKDPLSCIGAIKGRLNEGLEELDQDKLRLKLMGILIKMSKMIRLLMAAGSDPKSIEASHDFVTSRLSQNDYAIEIVASFDSKYAANSTLSLCVKDLQLPSSIGKHPIGLILLTCDLLEAVTDQIC